MMKERVFLLPAFCMATEALRETRCAFVYTRQYMLFLVLYRQMYCFNIDILYRGKNIIVQLQNARCLLPNCVILSDNV